MIALKIFRTQYRQEGLRESFVHRVVSPQPFAARGFVGLFETFECQGHVCLAFELHGRSLDHWVDQGPLPEDHVRRAAVRLLCALGSLHDAGFTHTDVKVGNLLYEPDTGEVRLADLGNARKILRQGALLGSREYTAPEVLVGAPLSNAVDLWSLGCCLFEMLTGRILFDPRSVAEKKYVEFDRRQGLEPGPAAQDDAMRERAEQFDPGSHLGGRYLLNEVLGQGRFATVWAAERLDSSEPTSAGGSSDFSLHDLDNFHESRGKTKGDLWRQRKGADDLLDLALNYEHAVLMTRLCGPFSEELLAKARYRESYFEPEGALRFRPVVRRDSVRNRLKRQSSLSPDSVELIADFLSRLLTIDPDQRCGVVEALEHPWLATTNLAADLVAGGTIEESFRVGRPSWAGSP